MKITFFVVLLVLSLALFADRITLNSDSNIFEHKTISDNYTQVTFTLDGYNTEIITEQSIDFTRISYAGEGDLAIPGKPDLPVFSRMFAIPNEGNVRLQISKIDEEIISDIDVFPRQELKRDGEPVRTTFTIDTNFYQNGKVFPEQIATIGEPAVFRDYRIVSVSINPFQYDPIARELRIVKSIDVDLVCEGLGGKNIKTTNHKLSRAFEPMYKNVIMNYNDIAERDEEFQQPCYLFIHSDNGSVATYLSYLTDWKKRKGFEVHTASTAEAGNTETEVKAYIQDAYDTWGNPPEYICLVGDDSGNLGVPPGSSGYGGSDHPYTQLEGGDILADAIVGRLSFSSLTEFQTILNKIFQYEMTPYMTETDWYNEILLVGDPSHSGSSTQTCNKSIKEAMQNYTDEYNYNEEYSGGYSTFINNNIQSGVSFFNYRGYIGMSGWSPGGYTNGPMMPNAVIITCATGSFTGSTSTTEAFLREGTPTVPKGAVTAIGTATASTHTMYNNCVSMGIFHGIFNEGIYNMGGALVRGKLHLYDTYSVTTPSQTQNFSLWNNLMGDPGMEVWTGIPEYMIVEHDNNANEGSNYFSVNVTNSTGEPLPGAWVTLLGTEDESVFATGYTDDAGQIVLELDPSYSDDTYLTVTAHDFVPYLTEFSVENSDIFVNISDITIDDDNGGDSSGNDDGVINPGEEIELRVYLHNYGSTTASGVSATISCTEDFVTISDASESYGDIAGGEMGFSSDDFDISIPADVLGGSEFMLEVTITDADRTEWTDYIMLTVGGPDVSIENYVVEDSGNGIMDPGETSDLYLIVDNLGSIPINNFSGTLICSDSNIIIEDAEGFFGNIEAGGSGENNGNTFEVTAGTTIIPGSLIEFEVNFFNNDGYDNTQMFYVQIGEAEVTDPLGPDAYGYYAYDSGDENYYNSPIYDWVEIDPSYGGSGTVIALSDPGDTGDIEIVDIPFGFRMYGEVYNEITICSNGWIAPGVTEDFAFMNWNIPGPGGPSPMIAAFWDDLKLTGGSHVCYYFDAAQHRFIVEWSHLQNDFAGDEETFQAILYDPSVNPTATGDSEILFQYKVINNTSQGSNRYDHGQYCTIGLEDPTGLIGLQYTFNNAYPTSAKVLEHEMAILLTGPPVDLIDPFIVIGGLNINDPIGEGGNGNGNADYGETIGVNINLNNLGEGTASDVSVVLTVDDPYLSLLNDVVDYPDIVGNTSSSGIQNFQLEIAEDCPDGHVVSMTINVSSNEDDWTLFGQLVLNAPEINYFSIFVDDGDNNLLDPGETVDIYVGFLNEGGAPAYNTNIDLSTNDSYISINSASYDYGYFNGGSVFTGLYNITVETNTPLGHTAEVSAVISADLNYTAVADFQLRVGFLSEGFESGDFDNFEWVHLGSTNWTIDSDSSEGEYSAKSGPISHNQNSALSITMNVLADGEISFYRKVSSEGNWDYLKFWIDGQVLGEWSGTAPWSEVTFDVNQGERTFIWQYSKDGSVDSGADCAWVDDIVFPPGGALTNVGFISGNITLSGGTGDVSDTDVSAGMYLTHPNSEGDFLMPLPAGNYNFEISLPTYELVELNNVNISSDNTTVQNAQLIYMIPPANLTAVVVNVNDVDLAWDAAALSEILQTSKDEKPLNESISSSIEKLDRNSREAQGYIVYRNNDAIAQLNLGVTAYTDYDLVSGEYEYFVTTLYSGGESEPTESETIAIGTSSDDELLPSATALTGNYPNPFNPSTTIKFQCAEAAEVELVIYNLKGQTVKTLIDSQMIPGFHTIQWDGRDSSGISTASGIYLYKIKVGNYESSKKMILLK